MKMGFEVEGYQQALKAMGAARTKDARNIADGLTQCAQMVFAASQKEVPVDKGPLKASGFWKVEGQGFGAVATIGYTEYYAVFVHEDLSKYHAPPTKAKFLTDPIRRLRGSMTALLQRQLSSTRISPGPSEGKK